MERKIDALLFSIIAKVGTAPSQLDFPQPCDALFIFLVDETTVERVKVADCVKRNVGKNVIAFVKSANMDRAPEGKGSHAGMHTVADDRRTALYNPEITQGAVGDISIRTGEGDM